MRKIVLIISLFSLCTLLEGRDYYQELDYCTWMGNATNIVAKNRDLGIDEFSLIGKYLEQGNDYKEQVVIISLIDQVFSTQKDTDADAITLETKSECLGSFFESELNNITSVERSYSYT